MIREIFNPLPAPTEAPGFVPCPQEDSPREWPQFLLRLREVELVGQSGLIEDVAGRQAHLMERYCYEEPLARVIPQTTNWEYFWRLIMGNTRRAEDFGLKRLVWSHEECKKLPRRELDPGFTYVTLVQRCCFPFGHLTDTLSRLRKVRLYGPQDTKLIVLAEPMEVNGLTWYLERLGWPAQRIEWFRPKRERLLVPDLLYSSNTTYPNPAITRTDAGWLRAGLRAPAARPRGRRMYLSRQKFGTRTVQNAAELEDLLRSHGFEEFDGACEPAQAAALFAEAEFLIGPHGSAFVNALFCPEGARAIELICGSRPNRFEVYCEVLGLPYRGVVCESNGRHDIRVDVRALASLLRATLGE